MNPWENDHGPAPKAKVKIIRWVFKKSGELPIDWDSKFIKVVTNFFGRLFK